MGVFRELSHQLVVVRMKRSESQSVRKASWVVEDPRKGQHRQMSGLCSPLSAMTVMRQHVETQELRSSSVACGYGLLSRWAKLWDEGSCLLAIGFVGCQAARLD